MFELYILCKHIYINLSFFTKSIIFFIVIIVCRFISICRKTHICIMHSLQKTRFVEEIFSEAVY
jgi:hypothetical protein